MNRTSLDTNALRHGSCRALVCCCQRASAAVVGDTIPLHATYVTSITPIAGDDEIPTHATICRQRLPLASTTHSLMLQYVASTYHWRWLIVVDLTATVALDGLLQREGLDSCGKIGLRASTNHRMARLHVLSLQIRVPQVLQRPPCNRSKEEH
jgi:hypothetical protein